MHFVLCTQIQYTYFMLRMILKFNIRTLLNVLEVLN